MINPISTSISGLIAAGKKALVAASNIANADTVGSTDPKNPNQAYSAQTTQDMSTGGGGVTTVSLNRNPPFVQSYAPDSPFADEKGMVNAPNVNVDEELMTLKTAEFAYKANAQALRTEEKMQDALKKALDHKA